MSLENFIKLYTGITCDFDGSFGTQCMDLMHFYAYICLDITDKTVLQAPNAKTAYKSFKPIWGIFFKKIDNTPTGVPEKGDIIFWGMGVDGHVAIFINGDVNKFNSFDANFPVGTKPHIQAHDYSNVLGWLRPIIKSDNCKGELEKRDKIINSIKDLLK